MRKWMDRKEAEFQAALLATFKVEAEEHLKAISDGLLELEKDPEEQERKALVERIFREAHSLKGAARSVGFASIQSLCQSLENVLSAWKQARIVASKDFFDTLYRTVDLIGKEIKISPASGVSSNPQDLVDLLQKLDKLILEKKEQAALLKSEEQKPPPGESPSPPEREVLEAAHLPAERQDPEAKRQARQEDPVSRSAHGTTVRVSLKKLDSLFQQVEEMLMVKLTFQQQMGNLKELDQTLISWDKKWARAHQGILSLQKIAEERASVLGSQHGAVLSTVDFIDWAHDFVASLKSKLSSMIRETSQYQQTATSSVDFLLDEARKMLMQPFSTVLDAFPRMVRDISLSQGKSVVFETAGTDIEVDRRILEEMKDPLIHLVRNCIDHGIETAPIRESQKKNPQGTIRIKAMEMSGNSMELVISDDGQGIDTDKVKDSAVRQGVLSAEEAQSLSKEESLKLIFSSGVSTAPIITDLSGRGIGLGIVAEKVEKLGGNLSVETLKNKGTTFRILLPLTLATFRGVHVKSGDASFIIPSHNVKRVIRIDPKEIKTVENRQIVTLEGKTIAVISLANLLGIETKQAAEAPRMLLAVIVKGTDKMIAFTVDQIVSEQDVLVKGLGNNMKRVRNVSGVSITDSGQIIPILNPQDLIKSSVHATSGVFKPAKERSEEKRTILIAEDSITSRLLLKNILEAAGYKVKVAVDGLEALSVFKLQEIDLIISDVEMPRMDGFTLTSKVRNLDKGNKVPVILCTSLDSPKDRAQGMEVGANAYIEKSQFTQSHLLDIIRKLI